MLRRLALAIGVIAIASCQQVQPIPTTVGSGGIVGPFHFHMTRIDKVDLLLAVDNSPSMADKQQQLARVLPLLVKELVAPSDPTIKGVNDLHVGVITSSLGSYGTDACDATNPHTNDHAHLLKRPGDTLPTTAWKENGPSAPPLATPCPAGIADASPLAWTKGGDVEAEEAAVSCVVESVGEDGCGYENQLESIYHFLIDPDPWQDAKVNCTWGRGDECGTNKIEVTGIDDDLLAERKAFLRPDSLLGILMISDENDASLKPVELNWLPWAYKNGQMQRGWDGCSKVPDDFEPDTADEFNTLHTTYNCQSCFESMSNPNCIVPWATSGPNVDTDDRNLRAFQQTQRFGYNFLWGRKRYVDGFKNSIVPGIDATTGQVVGKGNPIFSGGFRSQDMVVFGGILGVPRDLVQDMPTGQPKDLSEADWSKIISPDLTQRDARMVESIAPRAGRPKYKGGGNVSADPPVGVRNGNGGERDIADGGDLQYACIAPRLNADPTADCGSATSANGDPLCTPEGRQPYFKAYPSLRELRVVHDLGASGYVASICDHDYGPAITGFLEKMRAGLDAQCFKTLLNTDANGRVDCDMIEVLPNDRVGDATTCETIAAGMCTPGSAVCRAGDVDFHATDPSSAAQSFDFGLDVVASDGTATQQHCRAYSDGTNVYVGGDPTNPDCGSVRRLVCELRQINDDASCLHDAKYTLPSNDPRSGWCYSRDADVIGPACLKLGAPGSMRFLGGANPVDRAEIYPICVNNNLFTTPAGSSS